MSVVPSLVMYNGLENPRLVSGYSSCHRRKPSKQSLRRSRPDTG